MNEKYILKDNFEIVCYDDISILVKKDNSDNVFMLTDSAKILIARLDTPKTKKELVNILRKQYYVDEYTASIDIEDFLNSLINLNVRINFYKCKSLIIIEYKKIRCSNT